MHFRRFLGKIAGTYLAIGALSVSAYAVADVYPSHNNVGGWGHAPCGEPANGSAQTCCPQNECCNPPPACGVAYNPEAYFNCVNCNPSCNNGFLDSLRVRADFLWWRACEEGLSLGTEEFTSTFPGGNKIQRAKEKNPDFKYDPGFRIGLASICPCDCFDVALNWTHFHTKASVSGESIFDTNDFVGGSGISETVFVPEWQRIGNAIPDFSKGRWTLNLDLLDLEFGRKYYVSNCFVLRPHFGLRGARIDQGFRVHSEANRFNPYEEGASGFFASDTKAKNDFLGIGPRLGLDLELSLPCACNIKLFGQAAGSLLFGRFERHSREFFHNFSDDSSNPQLYDGFPRDLEFEAKATKERCSRATTDLAIGLKWEHCCTWCNRQHPITIAFAWEHHAFFNFNNFIFEKGSFDSAHPDFVSFGTDAHSRGCSGGDLTTQGLTVSAEIGF